jgi:hypothetical protein
MMKRKISLTSLIVVLFVCISTANANTVYTRLIDTSFIMTKWYDWVSTNGHLNFSNTSINGEKKLYTHDDVYTLSMTGTLTFNPNLGRDYSSGELAKGYFEGGATVTITGGLKIGASYVYGGLGAAAKQIFQATMVPVYEDSLNPTLNRWSLEESTTEAGRFDRTLFLDLVAGSEGLASGISLLGTGDILKMTSPKMDLSLKTDSAVSNFYIDMGPSSTASNIKITGLIPEPATLLLLGLGGICVRRKGK